MNVAPPARSVTGRFLPVAAVLVLLAAGYCLPLFTRLDQWGRQDWDQFTYRYATARTAILRDGVLPTWNPYSNGGTVLLAHPNSPVLSPWFAIVLLLDAPLGLRVQVLVFVAIGAVGMAAFVRRHGASALASVAAGVAYMMGSHVALHVAEGHLEWCALGLMPWLALMIRRAEEDRRHVVSAALLLASVLTFGAVQIPQVYLPFLTVWLVLEAARQRRWRPLTTWASILVLAGVVSSAKLLPTLEFASQNPREATLGGWTPYALLPIMFLDPRQDAYYTARRDRDLPDGHFAKTRTSAAAAPFLDRFAETGAQWRFHEYGCYIGLIGVLLAVVGAVGAWRSAWPLVAAGGLAFTVVLAASSPLDLWALMQRMPVYEQFRVPSRFLAAVIFVLAVMVGIGLDRCLAAARRRRRLPRWAVGGLLVGCLYLDLTAISWRLFSDIFVVPSQTLPRAETFVQRFDEQGFFVDPLVMDSNMYATLQANVGTLNAYENLSVPKGRVQTIGSPGYRGEWFFESQSGQAALRSWTMSSLAVDVSVTAPDRLVVNQNFSPGWRARRRTATGVTIESDAIRTPDGLIGVRVEPGDASVELYYRPASVVIGLWLSGLGLCACALAWMRLRRSPGQ